MNTNNRRPDTDVGRRGRARDLPGSRYDEAWNGAITDIGHARSA